MPIMGRLYKVQNPRLKGLRKWVVKDFKKYLIFYLQADENIQIVRILYARRDIERILEQEL
ncbi:type II toxin-antitoxin system RelE/ParE family toxin [Calothrix sp. NIES-2098]|uniref:type II toxin-antitoxin system RelE/ParE family toxin n=1 Tax=Calothrix sp. NIES-2098 TaxID=1954171 RepID=UPI0030DD6587